MSLQKYFGIRILFIKLNIFIEEIIYENYLKTSCYKSIPSPNNQIVFATICRER